MTRDVLNSYNGFYLKNSVIFICDSVANLPLLDSMRGKGDEQGQ